MPFTPEHAATIAASFDLKRIPSEFYTDPFPYLPGAARTPAREAPARRRRAADALCRLRIRLQEPQAVQLRQAPEFKPKYGDSPLYEHHTTSLVFNDPPLHTRVRRLIIGALTPQAIARMEPALVALVDQLLDAMAGRERVDLIEDFAAAIPIEIIGNLLDVPHGERGPLRDWSLAILGALEPVREA